MPIIHETEPVWDENKRRIVGGAPDGCFSGLQMALGVGLLSDWSRLEVDGTVIGYGWIDTARGDAEISIAIARASRGAGHGRALLRHLESAATELGFPEVVGVIDCFNPSARQIVTWLAAEGYRIEVAPGAATSLAGAIDALSKQTDIIVRRPLL